MFETTPWIKEGTLLQGKTVCLLPLEQSHFPELQRCAADARIWEFYSKDYSNPLKLESALEQALKLREVGHQYPFVVQLTETGQLIGSTRLMDLQPGLQALEIGFTWYLPAYWHTAINPGCKLLLLTYAFETLGAARITLQTDERNVRSRKAIQKIGAQYEGMLRSNMLRDDGTRRNSVYYSILQEEWDTVKPALKALLEQSTPPTDKSVVVTAMEIAQRR